MVLDLWLDAVRMIESVICIRIDLDGTGVYESLNLELECKVGYQLGLLHNSPSAIWPSPG